MVAASRPDVVATDGAVALRAFDDHDVDDVTAACQDPLISRFTVTIPWPYEEHHARMWIATHEACWATSRLAHFAIVDARDGRLLGAISVHDEPDEDGCVVGYWVAAWERRRGVASRALELACAWAFEHTDARSVTLRVMLGNDASEGVARRAGFTLAGEDPAYEPRTSPTLRLPVRVFTRMRPTDAGAGPGTT